MITEEQWNIYATLKNLRYRAGEYVHTERLVTVDKFLDYCEKINLDLSPLHSKYGDDWTRHIVKSVLKETIKFEQGRL